MPGLKTLFRIFAPGNCMAVAGEFVVFPNATAAMIRVTISWIVNFIWFLLNSEFLRLLPHVRSFKFLTSVNLFTNIYTDERGPIRPNGLIDDLIVLENSKITLGYRRSTSPGTLRARQPFGRAWGRKALVA